MYIHIQIQVVVICFECCSPGPRVDPHEQFFIQPFFNINFEPQDKQEQGTAGKPSIHGLGKLYNYA